MTSTIFGLIMVFVKNVDCTIDRRVRGIGNGSSSRDHFTLNLQ